MDAIAELVASNGVNTFFIFNICKKPHKSMLMWFFLIYSWNDTSSKVAILEFVELKYKTWLHSKLNYLSYIIELSWR
ncbi:hypothetical protein C6Y39_05565 [Alteromonas gracilis]|uniref:Uncharacterized protein n=1 Tax=Alteromonas gracilis TaxID=1479524 RepID=A0ABX5CQP8_9ALTE|nr:hypothetical protein C6Y39_05565 [Alteromonas gracilis]